MNGKRKKEEEDQKEKIRRNEINMGNRGGGWKKWREKEEGEGVRIRR